MKFREWLVEGKKEDNITDYENRNKFNKLLGDVEKRYPGKMNDFNLGGMKFTGNIGAPKNINLKEIGVSKMKNFDEITLELMGMDGKRFKVDVKPEDVLKTLKEYE